MKLTRRSDNTNERQPVTQQHDPVRSLQGIHEAMDRLFGESMLTPLRRFGIDYADGLAAFVPRVDISETEHEVKVRAEIPGVDPKDVAIEVTEDTLSLSGTVEKSLEENQENFYRIERGGGAFSREFMLPSKIDTEKVEADAKHGVITITLKKLPSEQKKRIEIKG